MNKILEELLIEYPRLEVCRGDIEAAFELLRDCYKNGGRVFVCGNGGGASAAEHIVGELSKSFKKQRQISTELSDKLRTLGEGGKYLAKELEGALPAISLNSQASLITAFANDKAWDAAYAQQLYGLGRAGDCLISISTSGNAKSCVYATLLAKAIGINSLSFTGAGGGRLKEYSTLTVSVPECETYKVQELHLPIYHALCAMLEEEFF